MKERTLPNTWPTFQLDWNKKPKGGWHGGPLHNGLRSPFLPAGPAVHGTDLPHLFASDRWVGTVPIATDGHQSGRHHRVVAAGTHRPSLDSQILSKVVDGVQNTV